MEYASRGVANAGLTTGIIGTALSVLNGGGGLLNGLVGGNCNNMCHENMPINRYEATMMQELSAKDGKIALLESNIYTDQKLADVYERLNGQIRALETNVNNNLLQQVSYNATNTATIACLQGQVAQLYSLTKLVVPNASVCPGWGNVTITPATSPTTTG